MINPVSVISKIDAVLNRKNESVIDNMMKKRIDELKESLQKTNDLFKKTEEYFKKEVSDDVAEDDNANISRAIRAVHDLNNALYSIVGD